MAGFLKYTCIIFSKEIWVTDPAGGPDGWIMAKFLFFLGRGEVGLIDQDEDEVHKRTKRGWPF